MEDEFNFQRRPTSKEELDYRLTMNPDLWDKYLHEGDSLSEEEYEKSMYDMGMIDNYDMEDDDELDD